MEVILLERIEKLGQMGDVVDVKPGYARNFLLPQRKALRATDANRAAFDEKRAQLEAENLERREEARSVASAMENLSVVIVRQASDNDHLYGSVTTRDVATAVSESGVTVDRQQVRLDRPIKTVGLHVVRITLHPEVAVGITVNVARSDEEAKMQAEGRRPGDEDEREDEGGPSAEGAEPETAPDDG